MRILHVGWWHRPYRGGGLIIYTESLMQEQVKQGHEVHYFCGGRYVPFPGSSFIRNNKIRGIHVYEVVNSPNLIWDYDSIVYHINNQEVENLFEDVISTVKFDVVHIQELESLSGGIIDVCLRHSLPVVMSLHNYWALCPQRDLIDYNGEVCQDYEEGRKCERCKVLPASTRLQWMLAGYVDQLMEVPRILKLLKSFYFGARRLSRKYTKKNHSKNIEEKFFTERRTEFVKKLNKIRLIAVSDRVKEIYTTFGVREEHLSTVHISSRAVEFIERKVRTGAGVPVKFGYIGGIEPHKGVHVLIEAFKKLDQTKCALFIHGGNISKYVDDLREKSKEHNIYFMGGYRYEDLNNVLATIDVGIAPQIWEDNSPQVVFEMLQAGIPVIGSRIGGIPDFVKDGMNGFLFIPGDCNDLAAKMELLLKNPDRIRSFSQSIVPHKSLSEHSKEIIAFYEKMM